MSPPPPASLTGPASHRAVKSSLPTSPLFPLSDNSVNCQSSRSVGGRNGSSGRCTSSFFPQSHWQDSSASVSLPYSSSLQHLPRNRLSFELNQSDSVEVPHNFLASPEPEDISPTNATSPHGDMGKHSKEFSYNSFHRDPSLSLGEEMRAELEIEETLLNEGVAMNCGGQIVVEGDDQEEFWGRTQELHKKKTLVANLPRSAASAKEELGNTSSDDDMDHYFDFSRTIVSLPVSKDRSKSPSSSSSRPLAQLDGIDDGTESDASVATTDDAQKVGNSGLNQIQRKNLNNSSETSNGGNLPNTSSNDRQTESSSVAISVSKRCTGDSSPLLRDASKTSGTPSVELKILPSSVVDCLPNLLTKVPETSYSEETILGSSLDLVPHTPLVFEKCDSTPCFTELLPVLHDTPNQSEAVLNSDPESNNFASEGSTVLMNHLAIEPSLAGSTDGTQSSLLGLLEPSSLMSADTQNHSQCLDDPLEMYSCLPGFSQPPLSSITLQPVMTTQESTNFPPIEPFSTNLTNLTPVEDVTEMQLNVANRNSPGLPAMPGTCPPAVTCATISISAYPTQTQPFNSAAVTAVSSSSMVSTHCSAAPTPLQTTTAPVILNGYSSSSVQKEPTAGHTISINFSTPRPAMEPQQPVLPQALPGHAILTVKEVGGPNVDPTPHVLLVNRLGQIFVKNPENNTFQLPTPNSSSYNCVTQIASLLQSNALSATLAAAGNMMAAPPCTNMTAVTGSVTPAIQNPATVTQLLANNNTSVALSNAKKSRKNPKVPKDEMAPEMKKPKKKKESNSSKKSKSSKAAGQASLSTETHAVTPADSAQAIINQAMASNYTPKWSGLRTMSPSSLVLPPGLLIEPEPPVSPRSPSPTPAPAPRPRTHVRMKRVSSLSDRIITKKSKVDFLQPEDISEEEEHQEATFPSISSRASGVRIKTPTVKGVLNLDELKEAHMSDSDSSG